MLEYQLLAIKAYLFAILALLLIILCCVIYFYKTDAKEQEQFFCGNYSPAQSSTQFTRGKELFIQNCASCHNKNMVDALTGPALRPALQSWAQYPASDLYKYIRDSQSMKKKRHPRAVEIWKQYQPTIMNSFKELTDEDIRALLDYIRG